MRTGIDLGGARLQATALDRSGSELPRERRPTLAERGETAAGLLRHGFGPTRLMCGLLMQEEFPLLVDRIGQD